MQGPRRRPFWIHTQRVRAQGMSPPTGDEPDKSSVCPLHFLGGPFMPSSWSVSRFPVHTMGSKMYFQDIQQWSAFAIQAPPATRALTPTPTPKSQAHSFAGLLIKNLPILRRLSTRLALRYSPLEETQDRAHARLTW